MIILLKLFLAHLAGDFLLQPRSWVEAKEKRKAAAPTLYLHMLLHGALVLLLLGDLRYWPLALAITGAHGVIDILKIYLKRGKTGAQWFLADQLLHLLCIAVCYYIWFQPGWDIRQLTANPSFWICLTAVIFLTSVSGIVIQILMKDWSDQIRQNGESLSNAGKYIGILERTLVFIFILAGYWEATGFLLAAKSVFRFGDLKESKDRKLTEYILIGTLLSFGIAIVTSLSAQYLIRYCADNC